MKLCFHHEYFDVDVSSGTVHAAYQWHELCMAFGIETIAVINKTEDKYPKINNSIKVIEYKNLESFLKEQEGRKVFIEQNTYVTERKFKFKEGDWIIIGGANGLPISDVMINTGGVALYPREAASIILNEVKWQLR